MRLECAVVSEKGRRPMNQDAASWREVPGGVVCAVGDGLGGHPGSERASQVAVREFCSNVQERLAVLPPPSSAGPVLAEAVKAGHAAVRLEQKKNPDTQHMATTLVGLLVLPWTVAWVHVGDSRLYLLRGGMLHQLTQDHNHDRHTLARALGTHDARPDVEERLSSSHGAVQPGDAFLLCSDGLHGFLGAQRMHRLILNPDVQQAASSLQAEAYAAGSTDNITALVVRVTG